MAEASFLRSSGGEERERVACFEWEAGCGAGREAQGEAEERQA